MNMDWKTELRKLESNEEWDSAIELMEKVINKSPMDVEPYIFMMFLIKNLLVEEDYNRSRRDFYTSTLKKYFDCSYKEFKDNAEYLFYTGWTACMCPWYFGITREDADKMIDQSLQLEPDNFVYQSGYYIELDTTVPQNKEAAEKYAQLILQDNSVIATAMKSKGACGECVLECMYWWSKKVLGLSKY